MKMKTLNYFLMRLLSVMIAGAVISTAFVDNSTYETLVLVFVWFLIVIGFIATAIYVIATILLTVIGYDDKIINANDWDKTAPINFYIAIPLAILWLGAFVYVEWTATAVTYLIQVTLMYLSGFLFQSRIKAIKNDVSFNGKERTNDDDLTDHIKDPTVKKLVKNARKY